MLRADYLLTKGTSLICSFLEIFMSFSSPKVLKRVFPPIVTGLHVAIYATHKTYP